MIYLLLLPVLFPILAGVLLLVMKKPENRNVLLSITGIALIVTDVLAVLALVKGFGEQVVLFDIAENLSLMIRIDEMGVLFNIVAMVVLTGAGFFSFEYMKHEDNEKRYYGFYLLVFGVLNGLCFAGNMVTFYLCFELLTISSMPLVLHNGSREAIMAAMKYLFFSLCGAYMALFGIYFLYRYGTTLTFGAGGVLDMAMLQGKEGLLLIVAFLMILGFSVKEGMFPMHAWLPTAHPVAPAPASAILSAVIVKGGVLGIIRVVFYMFGTDFLRGTWVQKVWIILTLLTVFMGSMLAYREPVLKKRLAYSTVSQLSYILFGLAMMDGQSVTGGILHVAAHAFIKATLFLCAGAIIYKTGKTRVEELRGIGKQMPVTIWCFTIVSLGLIGIPPTGGFVSKWYLATGALQTNMPVFSILGPVVLLVSALLTAGYLLPVTIMGFFPGKDYDYQTLEKKEPNYFMTIPLVILTGLSVLIGLFPNALVTFITNFVGKLV